MQQSIPVPANVVSQRLCDLLLSFPCAACDGVQWRVLAARYKEKHGCRLDLEALGQTSALGAATTLLWDVLRIVDKEDTDNPVVGIEDGLALTPQPDAIACWPSLYKVLCDIVLEHGSSDKATAKAANRPAGARFLLLSCLRPLLDAHWQSGFDETSLSYRSEDGAVVRFKKIKHLLQALLRWREQRQAWQQASGCKPSSVDDALRRDLELVPSKKHNDLMLCCRPLASVEASIPAKVMTILLPDQDDQAAEEAVDTSDTLSTRASISSLDGDVEHQREEVAEVLPAADMMGADLRSELQRLRAENEKLRATNLQLQGHKGSVAAATPSKRKARAARAADQRADQKADRKADQKADHKADQKADQTSQPRPVPQLPADLFDDPFEPPPEMPHWARPQSSPLCRTPSEASTMDFGLDFRSNTFTSSTTSTCASGAMTPIPMMQAASSSTCASGAMTPLAHANPQPAMQTMMPVWFPFMQMEQSLKGMMDVAVIPRGIVQGARERFENIIGQ